MAFLKPVAFEERQLWYPHLEKYEEIEFQNRCYTMILLTNCEVHAAIYSDSSETKSVPKLRSKYFGYGMIID